MASHSQKGFGGSEIELDSEEQAFAKPVWLGQEVTADKRYLNANLLRHPYLKW